MRRSTKSTNSSYWHASTACIAVWTVTPFSPVPMTLRCRLSWDLPRVSPRESSAGFCAVARCWPVSCRPCHYLIVSIRCRYLRRREDEEDVRKIDDDDDEYGRQRSGKHQKRVDNMFSRESKAAREQDRYYRMSKLRKSLGIIFPAMRISIALSLLTACILLTADMLGFHPGRGPNSAGCAQADQRVTGDPVLGDGSAAGPEKTAEPGACRGET